LHDLLDQIFGFMVRDFSKFALEIHQEHNATEAWLLYALALRIR